MQSNKGKPSGWRTDQAQIGAPGVESANETKPLGFTLEHVQYGEGNVDHWGHKAFAGAYLKLGPMWLRVHLRANGDLVVTDALHDDRLRLEIGIAFRKAIAEKLRADWARRDELERERFHRMSPPE